mgnify:CR=1 FL=1
MSFGLAARRGAAAYSSVGVETGVSTADPHKLILMLFEGALLQIGTAAIAMDSKDIPTKGKSISKAIDIINNGLNLMGMDTYIQSIVKGVIILVAVAVVSRRAYSFLSAGARPEPAAQITPPTSRRTSNISSLVRLAHQPGMDSILSSVPPVCPSPRPES